MRPLAHPGTARALAALESSASSNLLRLLNPDEAGAWLQQPWQLLKQRLQQTKQRLLRGSSVINTQKRSSAIKPMKMSKERWCLRKSGLSLI